MYETARNKSIEPHTEGDLSAWGGIVSGRVSEWTDALNVSVETFLQAIEEADVELLVDTARDKGGDYDRATAPDRRCLAMRVEEAERLRSLCDKVDPAHNGTGSTEGTVALPSQDSDSPMDRQKTEDLRVRVTPETYERVEAAAAREGQTVSGWVREWMRRGIDHTLGAKGPASLDRTHR